MSAHLIQSLRFVVIGAYLMDCFVSTSRLPRWGVETEARSIRTSPGGKALNQAVALARLGAQVASVGVVGDDGFGHQILTTLEREGIDRSGMQMRPKSSTSVCVCLVSDRGESSTLWHVNDDVIVTPEIIGNAAQIIEGADATLMTFEMPLRSVRKAVSCAYGGGTKTFVQPAPPVPQPSDADLPWDHIDVIVPNENEARALLGDPSRNLPGDQLAAALADRFPVSTIVVTLGAAGCVAYSEGVSHRYPAHEVVVIDTTGAGDAFAATLAAHLLAGHIESDAVHAAQAAAAQTIQRSGSHESMPRY